MKRVTHLLILACCLAAGEHADPPAVTRQVGPFGRAPITGEPGPFVFGGYVDAAVGAVDEEKDLDGRSNRLSGFEAFAGLEGMVRLLPEAIGVASLSMGTRRSEEWSVDEAYVRLDRSQAYIRLGRTHQWFGWERFDAPELWRINTSYTYYNSGSLDGGTLGWRFTPEWRLEVSAANEIITPDDPSQGKGGNDLGYGAKLRWDAGDGRTWDLTAFIDTDTAEDIAHGGYADVSVCSTWGEWRRILGSPVSAAADMAYAWNPDGDQIFALGTLRVDGDIGRPAFATLMATWLEEDYDRSSRGEAAEQQLNIFSNRRLELALAGFVFPTGDYHYRVGMEVRALDSTVDGEDELSVHLAALAVIP
ncbi:MAG: hypothetical protein J0M02_04500 [Planctomycetes bacterium]|nr:hypothetical protein [Planctomycetota bacterium]